MRFYKDGKKKADGSMSFGFGMGNPNESFGTEVSVGIISMTCQDAAGSGAASDSCFGSDGNIGIKLHKMVSEKQAYAIGYSNPIIWGDASTTDSIYAVTSRNFTVTRGEGQRDMPGSWTLGVANGNHRSKGEIDAAQNDTPNVFGGVGLHILPRVSLATSWNGSAANVGFGLSLFDDIPISLTVGVTDVTNNRDNRSYSINTGYSFSY